MVSVCVYVCVCMCMHLCVYVYLHMHTFKWVHRDQKGVSNPPKLELQLFVSSLTGVLETKFQFFGRAVRVLNY